MDALTNDAMMSIAGWLQCRSRPCNGAIVVIKPAGPQGQKPIVASCQTCESEIEHIAAASNARCALNTELGPTPRLDRVLPVARTARCLPNLQSPAPRGSSSLPALPDLASNFARDVNYVCCIKINAIATMNMRFVLIRNRTQFMP